MTAGNVSRHRIALTALMQQREDQALAAAWRRCEAALPEGASLELRTLDYDSRVGYVADAQGVPVQWAPTPTAALEALADRLERVDKP